VVDRSLETLAADRGITICFVDLDDVDGLWLPDERTILVNSRLDDRRATEVLDHELAHVDIEDGHAALDASVRRRAGRTRLAVAATAAACMLVLGAVRLLLPGQQAGHTHPEPVAGHTTAPPQTDSPQPSEVPVTTVVTQVFKGEVRTQTVTVPPRTAAPSPTPTGQTPAGGRAVPSTTARTVTRPATTAPTQTPVTTSPVPTVSGTPTPTLTPSTVPAGTGPAETGST